MLKEKVLVHVTWMDGKEVTCEGYQAFVTDLDNLVIDQQEFTGKPKRVIPLRNVRYYTIEEK